MLTALDYALLWTRALASRVRASASRMWQLGTHAELFTAAWLLLCVVVGLLGAIGDTEDWSSLAVVAIALWAYLDLLNDTTRSRANLWVLMREKPAGAPAAVIVDCPASSSQHRLAYTGGHWQEIK